MHDVVNGCFSLQFGTPDFFPDATIARFIATIDYLIISIIPVE
ncbi:MAG: hypothetical protein R3256_00920 [Thalassovita sp.]|nr:hypothetical protein [Thalassovita sp.]